LKYLPVSEIQPDPRNREYFPPLNQEELDYLAKSIGDHGLINPITITPDNVIIAGEQRWRACVQLGLNEVPVIIRKPKDDLEVEELRIAENLARRNVPLYSYAKALERQNLIKLQRLQDTEIKGANNSRDKSAQAVANEELMAETGLSESSLWTYKSLAKLIPELGKLLDEENLSREVAYQLSQLEETDQYGVLNRLREARLTKISAEEMRSLKLEIQASRDANAKLHELISEKDKTFEERMQNVLALKIAEAERDLEGKKRKVDEREKKLKERYQKYRRRVRDQQEEDKRTPVYKIVHSSASLLAIEPEDAADRLHLPIPEFGEELADSAQALAPWLVRFAKHLHARVRATRGTTLKEVKK
jgi:ParB family chromosome partitioning protein